MTLEPRLWNREFVPDTSGSARLRDETPLTDLLACYPLERVWRTFPQVEWRDSRGIEVITFSEWARRTESRRTPRPNQTSTELPPLPGVENEFELLVGKTVDHDRLLAELRAIDGVISAELVRRPEPAYMPTDPGWVPASSPIHDATLARGRWGLHNTGVALGSDYLSDFDIDAPEAWDLQRGDPSVTMVILDGHTDVTHEDLYLNVFLNNGEVPSSIVTSHRAASADDGLPGELTFYDLNEPTVVTALAAIGHTDTNANGRIDGVDVVAWWSNGDDADLNGFIDDLVGWNFADGTNRPFDSVGGVVSSHGIGVAGLVAAIADNDIGVAGVAHRIRVLTVHSTLHYNEILYGLSFPSVRVLNHSMSGIFGGSSASATAVLETLDSSGVQYFASLGNRDDFYYGGDPSRREEVVSVSNFDRTGKRATGGAGMSGYGPKTDIASPAQGVYSLQLGGGTRGFGATSGASPIAAAVGALVTSEAPTLTPEQIRQTLRMTAVDPGPVSGDRGENTPGWDLFSGWGVVNAFDALTSIRSGNVFPAANIVSQTVNFRNRAGSDELAIGSSLVDVRAIAGVPGEQYDWTIRRSENWDLSGATVVASGRRPYLAGPTTLSTLNTDLLDGRQIIELEVRTLAGVVGKDRAVIDLPRAYISGLTDGQPFIAAEEIEGFAYGPGFSRYSLQVAPGWSPAPSEFVTIHVSTTAQQPSLPVSIGSSAASRTLLTSFDPLTMPITLPDTSQFTLRLVTEGDRTWTDEIQLLGPHSPPIRSGFPIPAFYSNLAAPTAVDLDGDGFKELIISGNGSRGAVEAYDHRGTILSGWDVELPVGHYLWDAPAVGDIDGDGRPEVVIRGILETSVSLHVIEDDGTLRSAPFPLYFDAPDLDVNNLDQHPPVLADVTGDGRLDILISLDGSSSIPSPRIRAIDGVTGTTIRDYTTANVFTRISAPLPVDIDGDGEIEIAAVASSDHPSSELSDLYVWRRDGTLRTRADIANYRTEGPIACDIDGDQRFEMIVGGWGGGLSFFDDDGSRIHYYRLGRYRFGLGCVEFSPVSSTTPRVYAGGSGSDGAIVNLPDLSGSSVVEEIGWPALLPFPGFRVLQASDPIAADLAGDSSLEIGFGNSYAADLEPAAPVRYGLAEATGSLLENPEWPIRLTGLIETTPVVTDFEDDGRPELVIQTSRPDRSVFVFDLAGPTHPGWVGWGEYRHDPRRSANYHGAFRILHPTTARRQHVGPFDDASLQGALVIRTKFSRGAPVDVADPANWAVTIGSASATVREVASVQGEHWLLVDPVTQPAPGSRTLRVQFDDGGILSWDSYPDAVSYTPAITQHSTIPVIDKSGSMRGRGKIEAALVAARFFSESAYPRDEVGVVAFNSSPDNRLGTPPLLQAGPNRATIATAISTIPAGGSTSIGTGVSEALDILETSADPDHRWGLVLLSDGLENTAPYWDGAGMTPSIRSRAQALASARDFRIDTIALGPDADHLLLQGIADATGGVFYPVALGHSLSMVNRLADTYHLARENIDGTVRLRTHGQSLGPDESWSKGVVVPSNATRLQFALNWDDPVRGSELAFVVYQPDGVPLALGAPGVTFTRGETAAVYTTATPSSGVWKVEVLQRSNDVVETLLAVAAATVRRPELLVRMGNGSTHLVGWVTDPRGFALVSSIRVVVTAPDKTTSSVELRDDGAHGDGALGDGIFGGDIETPQEGSYRFEATATLPDAFPEPLVLSRTVGRFNRDVSDADADGMLDSLERLYADCPDGLQPRDDPDGDGLDNYTELRRGSNPLEPDVGTPGSDNEN